MPTPNGRLHLGHVAGPYLKMDVLARHLRRRGDRAWLISGTDAYESHVLLRARQDGEDPRAVARRFHALIEKDLASLDVHLDAFIDPSEGRWAELYKAITWASVTGLVACGATVRVRETLPYCPSSGQFAVGCWLEGSCPWCGAQTSSYFCESCGGYHSPDSLGAPRSRLRDGPLEHREVESLFLRIPSATVLLRALESSGAPAAFMEIARVHVERHGPIARLTIPGTWGIPWPEGGSGHVLFSYTAVHGFSLVCGEVCRSLSGAHVNAFHPDSGVLTVASFGIDVAASRLVAVHGSALARGEYKPYDAVLGNHFATLAGSKFSTGRGHAIWARDIADLTPVGSDAVRYYLALRQPDRGSADFDVDDFVAVVNGDLAGLLQGAVARTPIGGEAPIRAPSGRWLERLSRHLSAQAAALDLGDFRLGDGIPPVLDWIRDRDVLATSHDDAQWWAKALALLTYPYMPRFGRELWIRAGHDGDPTLGAFLEGRVPRPDVEIRPFTPVSSADLRGCLPETLRRS